MLRRYSLPLAILATGLLSCATLAAQTKRMVLIEEGTNASCPPCAAQNPTFEHFLNEPHVSDRVIPIIWHSNFPGRDVMNAANPTMHNGRVSYYGINGVPNARVNGRVATPSNTAFYAGAPADTLALARSVDAIAETSPIGIVVEQTRSGNTISGTVRVTSAEDLGTAKLYVAAVEASHYYPSAGTNGEKAFHWTARKMLPDHQGTQVDLAVAEGTTTDFSFDLDAEWNADEMYVVAWIQNDATKEVLQAASSMNRIEDDRTMSTAILGSGTTPGTWDLGIQPLLTGNYNVRLVKSLPQGWLAVGQVGDIAITDSAQVGLDAAEINSLSVSIIPSAATDKKGYGEVTVEIEGERGAHYSQTFRLYSEDIEAIVLQRDGGHPQAPSYYDRALRNGDYVYALIRPEDEHLFDWSERVVVMEVGKWALERADIAAIRNAFDRGDTRLFLLGAEIGFGLADPANTDVNTPRDEAIMENYLRATYTRDDNPATMVNGVAEDPIGGGLSFSIADGVQNQDTPDEIRAADGAVPVFYYGANTNETAGLRYADGRNRLVFIGFGAEGIGNESTRTEVLRRGIAWLLASDITTDVPSAGSSAFAVNVAPLPATDDVTVTLDGISGKATVDLIDLRGEKVIESIDASGPAGSAELRVNTAGIANGLYRLIVRNGGTVVTRPVMIVR